MAVDKRFVLRELRDLAFFLVASSMQVYFTCPRCNTVRTYTFVISFTFVMWVLLWKGNSYLTNYINTKISWLHFPVKRLIVGVLSTIVYTVLAMVIMMWIFENFLGFNFGSNYKMALNSAVIVTFVISLILHSREFLLYWRQATIEREKYEKESAIANYENLKNQVNPHFLFNSFNALSNLVYEDQDKAVKFIHQLSAVYRYVLDTREKEVVPINEELQFLRSYLYLQQIRFGDKFTVQISLENSGAYIAPLALQMLIENAIKHNIVSEENPLTVKVFQEEEFIVVENNLQKKVILGEPSAGLGLENICRRYEFLSTKKVMISNTGQHFSVKLPMLTKVAS
jgi:sensor histidine kinase YesM